MKKFFLMALKGYKKVLSPLLGQHCRFHPSCSVYAYQAVEKFGVWRGLYLSFVRLLKCQPLHPGGVDYVPENFEVKIKWKPKG